MVGFLLLADYSVFSSYWSDFVTSFLILMIRKTRTMDRPTKNICIMNIDEPGDVWDLQENHRLQIS